MFHQTKRQAIGALLAGTLITGSSSLMFAGHATALAHAGQTHGAVARHARIQHLQNLLHTLRQRQQVLTVTSLSGTTINAKLRGGAAISIATTSATTFREAGSTVALAAVQPREHILVRGTFDRATHSVQAKQVVIVAPSMTGVVTNVAGSTITLTGRNAVQHTISIGTSTKIEQAGQTATPQAIAVGSVVTAQGTRGAGGSFTVLRVVIRLPHLTGTIVSVNGTSFTLHTRQGKTYTITPASSASYVVRHRGAAATTTTAAPSLTVGERVLVQGSLSADGTTLTALRIGVAPAAAAQPAHTSAATAPGA
jgi:hypothetical protein